MNRRMFFKAAAVGGGAALGFDLSKAHVRVAGPAAKGHSAAAMITD